MRTACHYAIVRFMPFVETGEFANVGIVLFAPQARFFGFRLLVQHHARITGFFSELDGKVFRSAMRGLQEELERVDRVLKGLGTDRRYRELDVAGALGIWHEVIKPRETMIRFSEPRLVLAEQPQKTVGELFGYYVERAFATPDSAELQLERSVRRTLRQASLHDEFHPRRVGNNEYHANFPFVAGPPEKPTRVIKPLNLEYADPARIIDHGGQWVVRVKALRKRHLLPERVLFAVNGQSDPALSGRARDEIVGELQELGVMVTQVADTESLLNFAAA